MARIQLSKPWQNGLIHVLNYGMVALFAMTLAYWVWVFLKPSPTPEAQPELAATQTLLPSILASNWFGNSNAIASSGINQYSTLKLVGLLSPSQHQTGFAIFKLSNGQQQYAMLNQEITPGVQLESIQRNSVTIRQNGVSSEIALENPVDQAAIGITSVGVPPNNKVNIENQLAKENTPSPAQSSGDAPTTSTTTIEPKTPENTSAMIQRYIKQLKK